MQDILYTTQITVMWRPDTTYTVVQTCDWRLSSLQLLSTGFFEMVCLLQDLQRIEVPYAHRLLTSIDIKTLNQRVLCGSRRDADLNLGVFTGEFGEFFLQELAIT